MITIWDYEVMGWDMVQRCMELSVTSAADCLILHGQVSLVAGEDVCCDVLGLNKSSRL